MPGGSRATTCRATRATSPRGPAGRAAAYGRWAVGQPYANRAVHPVRLRFGRSVGLPGRRLLRYPVAAGPGPGAGRPLAEAAATVAGVGAVAWAAGPELAA